MLGEVVQQVELASGEGDRLTCEGHFASPGIDDDLPAEVDRCRPACGGACAAAATEDRLDAGDKFTGRKRFGDIVVGTEFEPEDSVDLRVASGEEDDRNVGLGPNGAADVEAVEFAREADVEQDEFGVPFGDHLQRTLAGGGLVGPVAVAPQVQLDEVGDVGVVFDDDDDRFVAHVLDRAS